MHNRTISPTDCLDENNSLAIPYIDCERSLSHDDKDSVASTPVRMLGPDRDKFQNHRRCLSCSGELLKKISSDARNGMVRSEWNKNTIDLRKMSSDASDRTIHETYNDDVSESNASSEQLSLGGDYTDTPRNMLWPEVNQDARTSENNNVGSKSSSSVALNLVYWSSEHKDDHTAETSSVDHKDDTSNAAWSEESQGEHIPTDNSSTPTDTSATSNTKMDWSEESHDEFSPMDARKNNFTETTRNVIASNLGTIKLHELEECFDHSYENILVIKPQEDDIFDSMRLRGRLNDSHSIDTENSGKSKHIRETSSTSIGSTTVDVMVATGSLNGSKTSTCSPTQRSINYSKIPNETNRQRSNSDDESTIVGGFRYTFDAPATGKLGVIIESSKKLGPTIHTVKDYSPLFGMVETGDKIIRLDGEWTSHMSTHEFTRLLLQKRTEKAGGILQITVLTMDEKPDFTCDEVSPRWSIKQSTTNSASAGDSLREDSDSDSESGNHLIGEIASQEDSWDMYESDDESFLSHL
mmetsp:Transcript_10146/g.15086  ORF Transcript_10146/g.15086 Transcript_10146/m.15086 type:complete len:524 (-) Transcript_10146:798-2369(-)